MNEIEFGVEKIENAKIKFVQTEIDDKKNKIITQIGFEIADNKVVNAYIINLDTEIMKKILNVLELRVWEELPKKYARISLNDNRVEKIGNIINNKWVKIC